MSLPRPTATITLNGQRLTSAEAGLARLRLDLAFNSHDNAKLWLWSRSKLATAEPGMTLQIGLSTKTASGGGLLNAAAGLLSSGGDDDGTVWTGVVDSAQTCAGQLVINGLADTVSLSQMRRSATWVEQTVADIVRDLAGELDSEIEAELDLPNFSVDNRSPVWNHLRELARLAGAELSCAAKGGLRFIRADKETAVTELVYGIDLIDWQLSRRLPPSTVNAAEYAAASSAGSDKWHWLAHDPVGSGQSAIIPAALRTRAAAGQFNRATEARAARAALRGMVWIGGRPELRPGMLLELKALPEGDSGSLRVRSVTHQLDGENSFITALSVEAAGSHGSGGLL
ncbi:Phage protein D [Thiothrix caldifontis]|uniref:Phage protein D n=1 Tax=Thiothrix caldifontis TaxID=525918 RepID=A0A1H4ANB0_9GAMM|nr:hypothetical protein [Thiothrix caldifontis]SEA37456.1 Phage protein D [Thiothrix caldifontis]